jgi:hypothetical protein
MSSYTATACVLRLCVAPSEINTMAAKMAGRRVHRKWRDENVAKIEEVERMNGSLE